MKKLTLKDVALFCGVNTELEGEISKISTYSRDVDENTLFIALIGERFDAHDFIEDVLKKGAKAVICSKKVCDDNRLIVVEDTGKALLDIAHGYRKNFDIPVIALTGSVGKTTTKGMIYAVISQKYETLKTQGNLNNEIGVPKTLFGLEENHQAAVIEMGMNHFGEISRLSKAAEPSIACITNIGTAHIENLGSREGVLKAKTEILDGMKKGTTLIVNADNDLLDTYRNEDYNIVRFGVAANNLDVRATGITSNSAGSNFTVIYKNKSTAVFVPEVGMHNVYNALCAITVALEMGYSLEEAAAGVKYFTAEGMRQKINKFNKMRFIEDCYNANLDSMCAALDALKTLKKTRSIAVLGDMLELGGFSVDAHKAVGEKAVETECDMVITYGEESKVTAQTVIASGCNAKAFDSKEEIVDYLHQYLTEGDTILFKGSRGMKMEDIFNSLYEIYRKEIEEASNVE